MSSLVHRQPHSSPITQKVQLTYKLFLLENARNILEEELRRFTNKAHEEVQGFLNSSFPTTVFSDLAMALDMKCQAVHKLTALLKDVTTEPQVCVQSSVSNEERRYQLQPLRDKQTLMRDAFKFGPMLQNMLMASSIGKAVQVLAGTMSVQQLKHFLISPPAVAQEDDAICSMSSSYNCAVQTRSLSCHLKAEEKEQPVIFEKKRQPDDVILAPTIIQCPEINASRPLLPPIQDILPEISNSKPMKITPLISWGWEDDIQVQHPKQTSSELLHFLKVSAKKMSALEVTPMEWSPSKDRHTGSPQSSSPTVKAESSHFSHNVRDDLIKELSQKTLCADGENEGQVFRVKQVEPSGSVIYTYVIATKTELWDVVDIVTQVGQEDSGDRPLEEKEDCRNITAQVGNIPCTEPEKENNSTGVKTPAINKIAIPDFHIRRFEEIEVVVSHVVSPSYFYIQHTDSITKLQGLVTDSWKASSSYALQNCIPDIGTQVMGWFPMQKQWCRAQVTKICGVSRDNDVGCESSIKVEVKRLDYGDTAILSLLNTKQLTSDMAALSLQALQVSLANVTPVNGSDWSEEAIGWFKAMVDSRTFYARLYPQGPKVTVELFLEKGKLGAMRHCSA
ncbi:uncharacterized protein LOC113144782 [Mastacembelus armatus]|uniref:uncharacterized protein LOC113144782 n=1 Tax=Mastacembelus armatus TaxID=205130 RepID=UPI000E45466D|nr:uncharacterized protein LOC113144782 [Mastacembelus armatus]